MTNSGNKPFKLKPYLKFSLIEIDRIDCAIEERDLNQPDIAIDRGAELILEVRGVINPLVVRRTNNIYNGIVIDEDTPDGRYELVNGFFEYFCAVRARKSDRSFEHIQAWISTEKTSKALENQLNLFREDDNFEDDFFALDFELVENESLDDFINKAIAEGSIKDCFDAADRLCQQYPAGEDRDKAVTELERIKDMASGDRTYQDKLDAFFAGTGEIY